VEILDSIIDPWKMVARGRRFQRNRADMMQAPEAFDGLDGPSAMQNLGDASGDQGQGPSEVNLVSPTQPLRSRAQHSRPRKLGDPAMHNLVSAAGWEICRRHYTNCPLSSFYKSPSNSCTADRP
jgi:hypothetical protein